MLLTVRGAFHRYVIECPDSYGVKLDHGGFDYLVVPNPMNAVSSLWLFDEILVEAARGEELGLKLISEEPLVPIVGRRRGLA